MNFNSSSKNHEDQEQQGYSDNIWDGANSSPGTSDAGPNLLFSQQSSSLSNQGGDREHQLKKFKRKKGGKRFSQQFSMSATSGSESAWSQFSKPISDNHHQFEQSNSFSSSSANLSRNSSNSAEQENESEQEAEQEYRGKVLYSLDNCSIDYRDDAFRTLSRLSRALSYLSQDEINMIQALKLDDFLVNARAAIQANQGFLCRIVQQRYEDLMHYSQQILRYPPSFDPIQYAMTPTATFPNKVRSSQHHMSNIKSLLHQYVREWSAEGAEERSKSYGLVIEQICKFADCDRGRSKKRVCVPGAGLGRLVAELASRGYDVEGCEFSFIMVMGCMYILNCVEVNESESIYPWIDATNNVRSRKDVLREIRIPDESATSMMKRFEQENAQMGIFDQHGELGGSMGMSTGDFFQIYQSPDNIQSWDVVVTCFFIDCAPNIIRYIQQIKMMLKLNGIWINYGPLLWHWNGPSFDYIDKSDDRFEQSLELTLDEIQHIIIQSGFDFLSINNSIECTYTRNIQSMSHQVFNCACWTARKRM